MSRICVMETMEIIIKLENKLYVHLRIVHFGRCVCSVAPLSSTGQNKREPKKTRKPSFSPVVTPQKTSVSQPKDSGIFDFEDREVFKKCEFGRKDLLFITVRDPTLLLLLQDSAQVAAEVLSTF